MFGLIETRDGLYGFRDLAAAGQVAQLLDSGIMLSGDHPEPAGNSEMAPRCALSNLRLSPESSDKILVKQVVGPGPPTSKGQFELPVSKPDVADADGAFASGARPRGGRRSQHGRDPLRARHELDPSDPAAGLISAIYSGTRGARWRRKAAYRWAVRADPKFAPAWHNLADLLDERGRLAEAVDCEKRALDANPHYADAMFNMALFLQRFDKHAEAATWVEVLPRTRPHVGVGRTRETCIENCEMRWQAGIEDRRARRNQQATLSQK